MLIINSQFDHTERKFDLKMMSFCLRLSSGYRVMVLTLATFFLFLFLFFFFAIIVVSWQTRSKFKSSIQQFDIITTISDVSVMGRLSAPLRELLPLPWTIGGTIPPCPSLSKSDSSNFGLSLIF